MSELLTASWDMRTLAPCGAVFETDRLRQKKNAVAPNGATASLAQREGFVLEFYKLFQNSFKVIICKILRSSPKTIINRFLTAWFEPLLL